MEGMCRLLISFILIQNGSMFLVHSEVFADSDFFQSSSVPTELIAGGASKEKAQTAAPTEGPAQAHTASSLVARPALQNTVKPSGLDVKKDMPREVFVEWVGGEDEPDGADLSKTQERGPANGSISGGGTPSKRSAPESRNIDDLLEHELRQSGEKGDRDDDAEKRFIEVN